MCIFYTISAHLSTPPGMRPSAARAAIHGVPPRFAGSAALPFMRPCIHFKRGVVIAHRNDLMKVCRKERCDRTCLLVLIDVAKLVRQQANILPVPRADQNRMAECKSDHSWAEKARSKRCLPELRIVRQWKTRHVENADQVRTCDPDAARYGPKEVR